MNSIYQSRLLNRQIGVTLIELMIVLVIIGILAAVGYPSYRSYVQRTHRTEAKSALLQIQTDQERFYLDNNQYTTTVTDLQSFDSAESEHGVYDLAITSGNTAQEYTATATPASGGGSNGIDMTDDTHCASFSITSDGEKSATNDDCW